MSDYRFQVVDHNGLESLHVMIDGEDGETHIPIDDIQTAISQHQTKHDGKLSDTGSRVSYHEGYGDNTQGIRIYGRHFDGYHDDAVLMPDEALSLLAWLEQERPTLEQLVKEASD